MLASIPVDVVLLGCTSGSLIEGPGYNQKIISLIEKASKGIPGLTTSTAVLQALRTLALGLKKIAVATAYIKAINDAEIRFLEGNGFKVTCLKGLELLNNSEFLSQPPYVLYNLAYNAYKERPEADGVFISCTSVRSPDVIEDLERNIGKPVCHFNPSLHMGSFTSNRNERNGPGIWSVNGEVLTSTGEGGER